MYTYISDPLRNPVLLLLVEAHTSWSLNNINNLSFFCTAPLY